MKATAMPLEAKEEVIPYITSKELARRLSISEKMVTNHTHEIIGRVKIGGAVRYNWPEIDGVLKVGKNPIKGESYV